jgi:hypothetical protein
MNLSNLAKFDEFNQHMQRHKNNFMNFFSSIDARKHVKRQIGSTTP